MRGGEGLRRRSEHLLELTTEMRSVGKFELRGRGFGGVTLGDEVFGQAALEFAEPAARGALNVLLEEALQLPFGNGAERGHAGRVVLGLPGQLLPALHRQKAQ